MWKAPRARLSVVDRGPRSQEQVLVIRLIGRRADPSRTNPVNLRTLLTRDRRLVLDRESGPGHQIGRHQKR
jgi:hypothetical protein